MSEPWIRTVVANRTMATPRVVVLDLVPDGDELLPDYEAGAHVDVLVDKPELGGAVTRQYSLCGTPGDRTQYRIAVLRDPASRGGSLAMHEFRTGDRILVSVPRNSFRLAPVSIHRLFAGGIGITPLLSMAKQLDRSGGEYTLNYCARTADDVSFAALLQGHPRVTLHLDDGPDEGRLDLRRDLGPPQPDTAIYVCGPEPFIDHVLTGAAALGWPEHTLHKERFTAPPAVSKPGQEFVVRMASTGGEVPVGATESILDALRRNGIEARSSCQLGICGECVVKVISGRPDHRDDVLSEEERAQGLFTPCCSRSFEPVIELDL
ncbi:PDR/VanB family oxidoreductase [Mycolicibacterium sp. CBM1]